MHFGTTGCLSRVTDGKTMQILYYYIVFYTNYFQVYLMLPVYFALCCCHTSMTHSVRAPTLHRRSSTHSKHMIGALGAK